MKITRLFIFIKIVLLLLPVGSLLGQNVEILIQGRIIDAGSTQRPLGWAGIVVRDTMEQFIAGTTSDDNGAFSIELPPGDFRFEYSFIGYQTHQEQMTITAKAPPELLIILQPSINELEQVNVVAEKSTVEYRMDRKVIHLGKDLQAIGGGSDLLDQLAEVQVSSTGQISMRGSDQVRLLLNGKPSALSNADLLQQISSADVVRVELITTPGARQQADGLSGMINIVTRQKAQRGFLLNLNTYASSNAQYQANLNLSYGTSVWGIQTRAGLSDRATTSWRQRSRSSSTNRYEESAVRDFRGGVKSLDLNIDYLPGKRHQLSVQLQRFDNRHDILSRALIGEESGSFRKSYAFRVDNAHNHQSLEANLNYRYNWVDKEQFLEVEWHRSNFANDLDVAYQSQGQFSERSLDYRNRIDNFAVDFTHPFHNWNSTLEGGLLITSKHSINTPVGNIPGDEMADLPFRYREDTWAGYSLLSKKWDKWQLQAGLRYELYRSEAQSGIANKNKFSNFFPSLHVHFAPAENQRFQLAYNRRTSRPSLWQLNPYSNPDDRYFLHRGNLELQPEFSHNLELSAQLISQRIRLYPTLFVRYNRNLINQIYQLEADRTIETFVNDGQSLVLGLDLSTSWPLFPSWEVMLSGNVHRERLHVTSVLGGAQRLYGGNIRWRHQLKIGKQYHFDISWGYYVPGQRRFGRNRARQKLDLAFRWQFWRERAQLGLRLMDLFNTFQYEHTFAGAGFQEIYRYRRQARIAYLNFNYRLAEGSNGRKRQRKKRDFFEEGMLE